LFSTSKRESHQVHIWAYVVTSLNLDSYSHADIVTTIAFIVKKKKDTSANLYNKPYHDDSWAALTCQSNLGLSHLSYNCITLFYAKLCKQMEKTRVILLAQYSTLLYLR